MSSSSGIVFIHQGTVPRYLRCALESARVFNPGRRVFLLSDRCPKLERWHIEVASLPELASPALRDFQRMYQHISSISDTYERFCIERWFLVEELRRRQQLERLLVLDSDCLLFHEVDPIFQELSDRGHRNCAARSPHCVFLTESLQPFLGYVTQFYQSPEQIEQARQRKREAKQAGQMWNLTDMEFFDRYVERGQDMAFCNLDLALGHLDHNLHSISGFVPTWRWRAGKKIFIKRLCWHYQAGRYLPFFQRAETAEPVRALLIHFQSGTKRRIRRFNPLNGSKLSPNLRLAFLNWRCV